MTFRCWPTVAILIVWLVSTGCGKAAGPDDSSAAAPAVTAESPPVAVPSTDPARTDQPLIADTCPELTATAEELAAEASAIVPLKPGLTLATTWRRATEGDDVECLTHIHNVAGNVVAATANCSMSTGTEGGSRRTCRGDMRAGYMYYTGAGDVPDILRGTTMFSLSRQSFRELKSKGSTRHRFVSVFEGKIVGDIDGALARDSTGTLDTVVNDRTVELPVIRATGMLRGSAMNKPLESRVTAAILDDERFPLVLDYALLDIASGFSVRYGKVSFPTNGQLEQQLAREERIDVYGIYFDVNSARIRGESAPVLGELADALRRHPDWQVRIGGHTDAVGTAAANLDLSQRRSEAVRSALAGQYGIAASRLSARGYGATLPKDTNGTPEGRARNRRVELVRQ